MNLPVVNADSQYLSLSNAITDRVANERRLDAQSGEHETVQSGGGGDGGWLWWDGGRAGHDDND